MDAIITHTVSGQWKMGTVSEQISAGIAGKTVAARCLSRFSTVLGIHRPKKGTGTGNLRETANQAGITHQAVWDYLHRGQSNLRKTLASFAPEPAAV